MAHHCNAIYWPKPMVNQMFRERTSFSRKEAPMKKHTRYVLIRISAEKLNRYLRAAQLLLRVIYLLLRIMTLLHWP